MKGEVIVRAGVNGNGLTGKNGVVIGKKGTVGVVTGKKGDDISKERKAGVVSDKKGVVIGKEGVDGT